MKYAIRFFILIFPTTLLLAACGPGGSDSPFVFAPNPDVNPGTTTAGTTSGGSATAGTAGTTTGATAAGTAGTTTSGAATRTRPLGG